MRCPMRRCASPATSVRRSRASARASPPRSCACGSPTTAALNPQTRHAELLPCRRSRSRRRTRTRGKPVLTAREVEDVVAYLVDAAMNACAPAFDGAPTLAAGRGRAGGDHLPARPCRGRRRCRRFPRCRRISPHERRASRASQLDAAEPRGQRLFRADSPRGAGAVRTRALRARAAPVLGDEPGARHGGVRVSAAASSASRSIRASGWRARSRSSRSPR